MIVLRYMIEDGLGSGGKISGRRIDRPDQQQRPVALRHAVMAHGFGPSSRNGIAFREYLAAVHCGTARRPVSARIPEVVMLRGDRTVPTLESRQGRGDAERIRRNHQGDDQHLRVAEYAPKSHLAGFPFRHTTICEQKCSKQW
ncbi:hypothetical protein [Rhizobium bangladeshense]|uniref:hypothetical protein n=1 Tax=Rhizobium bangladeshense TaxID=1138189 RepID=UPI0012E6FA45|nr:hypothetical protein [Rhizobium bangladeshense]